MGVEEDPEEPIKKTYHVTLRMYYPALSEDQKTKVIEYFKSQEHWDIGEPVDSIKNAKVSFMDADADTLVMPEADVTLPYNTRVDSADDLADMYNIVLDKSFQDLDNIVGQGHTPGSAKVVGGRRKTRRFKKKRLMSKKYCKKTPCRRMGFTQKASCRPYKNCYQ